MNKLAFNWDDLRKITQTKFVTSMFGWIFIVPVVAKAFEHIEQTNFQFVIMGQQIPVSLSLPFSWVLFYFSALLLALGNGILIVRCPKLVKDHLTYDSFRSDGKKLDALEIYSKDIKFPWSMKYDQIKTKLNNQKASALTDYNYSGEDNQKVDNADPIHYFWPVFDAAKVSRKWARRACTFFLSLGFLLFGVVLIQNLITVIELLLPQT